MHSTVYLWHHLLSPFCRDHSFFFFKAKKHISIGSRIKVIVTYLFLKNAKSFRLQRVISQYLAINFVWQTVVQPRQSTKLKWQHVVVIFPLERGNLLICLFLRVFILPMNTGKINQVHKAPYVLNNIRMWRDGLSADVQNGTLSKIKTNKI